MPRRPFAAARVREPSPPEALLAAVQLSSDVSQEAESDAQQAKQDAAQADFLRTGQVCS
jgi:outer membrane murein-binding lipoprotein Lpp